MANYDLGTARGRIEIDASGAKKGAQEAKGASQDIDSSAKSVGASAETAGLALTGLGAIALGAFAAAVKASADFEKSLSEFKAVTGSTTEQLDQIREKALQLGADTAFSAKEAADAMVELGKQGLSTAQILEGAADATVALAAAGGIELPEAASIAAAALNQFKLQASDLPHVADLLAGAANASATGVSELGQAMSFVGPVAQAMGLSIEDSVGALALFANNGIDASRGGTALRAILSRLVPASKQAAGVMQELGIITKDGSNSFFDAKGNVKSMSEVIGILNDKTKSLTAEQKINALQTIFGTEALAAANVMAGTTAKSFDELQDSIAKTKAADVAAERMNNLSGAMEELQGSIETVLIRAGSQFQTGITGIVKLLTQFVNALGNLNPEIQKWIGYLLAGGGAAAIAVGGILLVVGAVERFKDAWAALNLVISNNPIVRVIIIIAALVAAVIAAYKNIKVFHDFVDRLWEDFQPIWDGIRATVESFVNWLTNTAWPRVKEIWDSFVSKVAEVGDAVGKFLGPRLQEAWNGIQEGANGVLSWITGVFNPGMKDQWSEMQKNGATLSDWFKVTFGPVLSQVGSQIKSDLLNLVNWFSTDFVPGLKNFWESDVKPAWQGFVNWVNETFIPSVQTFANKTASLLATVSAAINQAMTGGPEGAEGSDTGLLDRIGGAWNAVVNFLQTSIIPRIGGFIQGVIAQFGVFSAWASEHLGPLFGAIGELIAAAFEQVGPTIQRALVIAQLFIQVWIAVVSVLWQLFGQTIINVAQAVWGTIVGVINGFLQILTGIINIATAIISGDWDKAWQGIQNIAAGAWHIIAAIVTGAAQIIVGIVAGLAEGVRNILAGAWNAITSKVSETWNGILGTIRGVISQIIGAVSTLAAQIQGGFNIDLFGAGRRILESLLNGIKSMFGPIQSALGFLTNSIPNWKGPEDKDEKLLAKNAELIMGGFASSLEDNFGLVKDVLGSVTSAIPLATVGSSATNNNSVMIPITINGVSDGRSVADALGNSGILRKITQAVRAGSL